MAVAERAPKAAEPASTDVVTLLGDAEMPAAELLEKVGQQAMSAAWGAGLIEFGHRKYVICGNIARWDSYYLLETGMEWSGPKTRQHMTFKELWAREATLYPAEVQDGDSTRAVVYRDATKPRVKSNVLPVGFDPGSRVEYTMPAPVTREYALKELTLKVRLTDKGLEKL